MVEQLSLVEVDEIAAEIKPPKIEKRTVKERRQQVLTVLTHMLHSERGMERMTTARLAEEVGVSEAALYRYFPSKTKMFEALIDNIEANLFSRITTSIRNETNTMNRVRDIMQMILDFARKNPGLTRILTGHALMFEEPLLQARVAQFFDRLEMQFVNILQMRKLREGRGFNVDERIIAGHLVTLCEGQFMRYVRTNFRLGANQSFEQQWRFLEPLFASLTLVDKYMIIPWQELPTETLENIVESVVLREGTDYGSHEFSLEQKKQHLLNKIHNGSAVIVWSELHESIDIKDKMEFLK